MGGSSSAHDKRDDRNTAPAAASATTPVPTAASATQNALAAWLWAAAIALLPLALHWWALPFVGGARIGNDYPRYPLQWQQELLYSLHGGTWPLFVPGFAGGQGAAALTLGQIHHPIAHLASLMPGYWDGYALDWLTTWHFAGLAAAHGALFGLLRRLGFAAPLAFLLGMAGLYNLRGLDCLRYGASCESWTGFWFVVTACGWQAVAPTSRRGPLLIALATWWTVTSGHPQMMYYALLGAGIAAAGWPVLLPALGGPALVGDARRRYWATAAAGLAGGVALSAAYVCPYYWDFVRENAERAGQPYAWATAYPDTVLGTLASLTRPLRADVHGAFGGTAWLAVGACLPLGAALGLRPPRIVWACWGLALLVWLHMLGDRTPVHWLAWKFLPLASSFRIAGRAALVLPALLLVPVAWAARAAPVPLRPGGRAWPPLAMLAACAGPLACLGWAVHGLLAPPDANFAPTAFRRPGAWVEATVLLLHVGALAGFAGAAVDRRVARAAVPVALVGSVAALALCFAYGTWVEPRAASPTWDAMRAQKRERLDYPHLEGLGLRHRVVHAALAEGALEPFLARVATRAIAVPDVTASFARRRADLRADEVVVEADPATVAAGTSGPAASDPAASGGAEVQLAEATVNRLAFDVRTPAAAWLVVGVPFTGHWRATVDGQAATVHRANGVAHALAIPAGRSRVTLRYRSAAATTGVWISALVFAAAAWWLAGGLPHPRPRWAARAGGVAVAALALAGFELASARGTPLGTEYAWRAPPEPAARNLAYGKLVRLSSRVGVDEAHRAHASLATDGDWRPHAGAITDTEPAPSLTVDLGREQPVATLVWYEVAARDGVNGRPLRVEISSDGTLFRELGTVVEPAAAGGLSLPLPPGTVARYLRVTAGSPSRLVCLECEVR